MARNVPEVALRSLWDSIVYYDSNRRYREGYERWLKTVRKPPKKVKRG